MKVYSFPRGGFLFNDHTTPAKDNVVNAFLPTVAVIPLGDNFKKAYPIVSVGEIVREGMLIGRGAGPADDNVHASVPGRYIKKISWQDRDGFNNEGLIIKMEGSFEKLGKREETFGWNGLSGYDLQKIIADYGIVEMENSGRSLSEVISLSRKDQKKITLVVRCVFDDPWLAADYALCRENAHAVIDGAAIVAKACLKVEHIIFAVSCKDKELGEMLIKEAAGCNTPVSLVLTGNRYPQHFNRELEISLRAYEKKEGLSLGSFLILGPAVLKAAHEAVAHKKPVLDRYVAVGGSAVKQPQIMKVRIGTRIGEIIEQCGGFSEAPSKIIIGSPLSGREISYLDEPVGKTCYAIAALGKSQVRSSKPLNCINCGECCSVCPIELDPGDIYKRIKANEIKDASEVGCQGCGCCTVVCPSALPLLETCCIANNEKAGG